VKSDGLVHSLVTVWCKKLLFHAKTVLRESCNFELTHLKKKKKKKYIGILIISTPDNENCPLSPPQVTATKEGGVLTLTNGLISRAFTFSPAFGTMDFRSEVKDKSILRTVFPEAFITLDGTQYPVGGLVLSGHHSYFNVIISIYVSIYQMILRDYQVVPIPLIVLVIILIAAFMGFGVAFCRRGRCVMLNIMAPQR